MSKRNLFLVLPVAATLFLSACGGAVERPSTDELATGLTSILESQGVSGLTEEQVTCIAEGLEASDLSDSVLAAVATGDAEAKIAKDDETKLTEVMATVSVDCIV